MALPPYVAPNDLVASSWGNLVVDELTEHDTELARRGLVVYGDYLANAGPITTTVVDIITVNWTAIVGRAYKLVAGSLFQTSVGNDTAQMQIVNAGAAVQVAQTAPMAVSLPVSLTCTRVFTGLTGAQTTILRWFRSSGSGGITLIADGGKPTFLMVEDLGP